MAKLLSLVLFLCLLAFCSAYRLQKYDMEMFRDEDHEKRLEPFSDEDEPEAISNTKRLLDAIMLDQVTIKGGNVEWFYGKGEIAECVDGRKSVKPKCRWTGLILGPGESKPTKEKIQVIGKYCNRAGLTKPGPKTIDC